MDKVHSGYTGSGYVDFQAAADATIQWNNIVIGSTGTKNIKIRYAQQTGTRNLDVYVNGEKVISEEGIQQKESCFFTRSI